MGEAEEKAKLLRRFSRKSPDSSDKVNKIILSE